MHFVLVCFVGVVFVIEKCRSATVTIMPNDRVLFLGNMNTLMGSTDHVGFVNIFTNQVNSKVANVTFLNAGYANVDNKEMLTKVDTALLPYFKPNKVIVTFGVEVLADVSHVDLLPTARFELESIVARLVQDGLSVVLCPIALHGEKIDGTNGKEDILEEYLGINKQIARDYDLHYVNLAAQVSKYLEKNNMDNLPHSVLTLDGSLLNEKGHMFVALTLLRSLNIESSSLQADNVVVREMQRVSDRKEELFRIQQWEQSGLAQY